MSPTLQAYSLLAGLPGKPQSLPAELPGKPVYTVNKYLFYVLDPGNLTIVVYIPLTYRFLS